MPGRRLLEIRANQPNFNICFCCDKSVKDEPYFYLLNFKDHQNRITCVPCGELIEEGMNAQNSKDEVRFASIRHRNACK